MDYQSAAVRFYKWRLRSTPPSQLLSKNISPHLSISPSLPTIISAQLSASMQSQGVSRFLLLPPQWIPTSQVLVQQPQDPSPSWNSALRFTPTSFSKFSSALMKSDNTCSMADGTLVRGKSPGSLHSIFLSLWILNPRLRFSSNAVQMNSDSGSPISSTAISDYDSGKLAMKVFWESVNAEAADALMGSTGVEEILLPAEAIYGMETHLRSSSSFLPPSARKFQNWDVGLLERFEE